MDGLEDSAIKTYRYLRLGLAGVVVMLLIAVGIEAATRAAGEKAPGSISAYYYTPVVGVFVGVLVAAGFGLIMVKGREGWEDILLNVAGMLAPVVALVPTPISEQVGEFSTGGERTVPEALVPTVHNNVAALLVVGWIGLLAAGYLVARPGADPGKHAKPGLLVVAAIVVGGSLWFWWGRDSSFLELGHYAAAIPMFALLVLVAAMNARWAGRRRATATQRVSPRVYGRVYLVVAALMGAVVVAAVAAFAVAELRGASLPETWLFWVELALLILFMAFWLTQSAENWNVGMPTEAEETGEAGQAGQERKVPAELSEH